MVVTMTLIGCVLLDFDMMTQAMWLVHRLVCAIQLTPAAKMVATAHVSFTLFERFTSGLSITQPNDVNNIGEPIVEYNIWRTGS